MVEEPAPGPVVVDTAHVLSTVAFGGYKGAGFVHATRSPYPSNAATGSFIEEWVSSDGYAEYSKVDPATIGSRAQVPPGTIVVRAVEDASGNVTKLTLMCKGPIGYNDALGDWWFAETDPEGNPIESDAGAIMGRVEACYSCHVPRINDDYLFGVPLGDRP